VRINKWMDGWIMNTALAAAESAGRADGVLIGCWLHTLHAKPACPPTQFTVDLWWSGRKLADVDTVHVFTPADQSVRGNSLWSHAAGGLCRLHCLYDVTTIRASVCVFGLVKVLLSCSRMSSASCNTLWQDTDAISAPPLDRAPPPPVRPPVSSLSPPSSLSFTAELDVTIIDNQEKIDFKQIIIDFQEKTILTSLPHTQCRFKKLIKLRTWKFFITHN